MFHEPLYSLSMPSPVGRLRLVAADKGLRAVLFNDGKGSRLRHDGELLDGSNHPLLVKAQQQLAEYFQGRRKSFDVKLDPKGTVFQLMAWKELRRIPYGATISYGEQARRVGDAKKARAVGMANGRNPISIIVPCHRVIGENGALTGFGGGLDTKRFLLELEQVTVKAA